MQFLLSLKRILQITAIPQSSYSTDGICTSRWCIYYTDGNMYIHEWENQQKWETQCS